ncbi:hypothetical protein BDN71DRAFT_1429664 [Pleurotus eryngii]|uniref:Uncharacterized protein n=1 Tax=Pleurotus eryngii TaxID=5323 RepID=A0A9P6A1X7_PLEER|nr:hypothetical protein BDN71DRAFT_1429664 [Pleurotus eryngii]
MAACKSIHARIPAHSHKAVIDASDTTQPLHQAVIDTASAVESANSTLPCSAIVSVSLAPHPIQVSPRKHEVPANAPAVEVSNCIPTTPVSWCLSFGTAVSGKDKFTHNGDSPATPPIAVLQDVAGGMASKPKCKSSQGIKKPAINPLDLKAAQQANSAKW